MNTLKVFIGGFVVCSITSGVFAVGIQDVIDKWEPLIQDPEVKTRLIEMVEGCPDSQMAEVVAAGLYASAENQLWCSPETLKQSHNDFISFCNEVFPDNGNQKRSIAEFTQAAEARKAEAQSVMVTNQVQGLVMMMEASEMIHRATGHILEVQNEAARWAGCPYDSNAAWDYIVWHEDIE